MRARLRARAGLDKSTGAVRVGDKKLSRRAREENTAYMPADRLTDHAPPPPKLVSVAEASGAPADGHAPE